MNKLDGKICDACHTRLYPNDRIYEFCRKCANFVWCVINKYEDGSKELSSIHHTEEGAKFWVENDQSWIEKVNKDTDNKIVDREIVQWCVF